MLTQNGERDFMRGMEATNDMNEVVNRHIARTMSELEEAGCPVVFRNAVKSNMQWLRKDLNEMNGDKRYDRHTGK